MKFKSQVDYTLTTTDYIGKAFTQIPVNAFVDKGRCGIGGTTKEVDDKTRHTIMVCPSNGIITDKTIIEDGDTPEEVERKKSIFAVRKGVTVDQVLLHLQSAGNKKIMTTPDSFWKIIEAAKKLNDGKGLQYLYNNYFLLIDEGHTIITESFRSAITLPLRHFWKFKNKTIMSATPYLFSNPKFSELDYHKIRFGTQKLGNVTLVETTNVINTLKFVLTNAEATNNQLHIFFNSVKEIGEAVRLANLKDCSIYCADKSENLVKLGNAAKFFKTKPSKHTYSKINLYTTCYFEGWDLKDDGATLLLVTDAYKQHTKVGVSNKGVQALGRIREPNAKLIHITNHRNLNRMKSQDQLNHEYKLRAMRIIDNYNQEVDFLKSNNEAPLKEQTELVEMFATIDNKTKHAIFDFERFDQIVNEQICNEEFNNIAFIKQAWENASYSVTLKKHKPESTELPKYSEKRLSKAKRFEQLCKVIKSLNEDKEQFLFNTSDLALENLKERYLFEFKAYELLGYDELEQLKFNEKAIKTEIIKVSNLNAEAKLLRLLNNHFNVYQSYTKAHIKNRLQELYDILNIKRVATAEQLGESGRFDLNPCKIKNGDNTMSNGFQILRSHFDLKIAA
jgi:hypothetical protein